MIARLVRIAALFALCASQQSCGLAAFYCLEKYSEHHHVPFGCNW